MNLIVKLWLGLLLAALGLVIEHGHASQLSQGLQGYWQFDETFGSAVDSSGNDNRGLLFGDPRWAPGRGRLGGALRVGTTGDDYVEMANATPLQDIQEGNYTVSVWFKAEVNPPGLAPNLNVPAGPCGPNQLPPCAANDAYYGLVMKQGPPIPLGLFYAQSGRFIMNHPTADTLYHAAYSEPFTAGQWHLVTGVVNRQAGTVKLYVDGVPKFPGKFPPNQAPYAFNDTPWRVGIAQPHAPLWRWAANGLLDDVRIYNRALTDAEVAELAGTVEVYPGPGVDTYLSKHYAVEVFNGSAWIPSYTYQYSRTSVMPNWHYGKSPTVSFTTFGTMGAANVRVRKLAGPIRSVAISPQSKMISGHVEGGQVTFRVGQNDKLWLTIDQDDTNPLFIFADAPKPAVPPGASYFGPGIAQIDHYKATDNEIIYLDGGAWVKGNIDIRGTYNVRIMGPGVLSGELWPSESITHLTWEQTQNFFMISGDWFGNSCQVRDITIVNPPSYAIRSAASVYSAKLLAPWFYSTDGFYAPHVDHVFIFNGDNTFFPMAGWFGSNVTITNSFGGNTGNGVFIGGYWGQSSANSFSALADNIDVKTYGGYAGAPAPAVFQIWVDNADSSRGISNQTYQNIRIEGDLIGGPLASLKNFVYPWGGYAPTPPRGNSYNLVFRNITLQGTQAGRSELLGLDANNGFHNVIFERLTINGQAVTQDNASRYFEINPYVWGLVFK